jgi:hypothetical protein
MDPFARKMILGSVAFLIVMLLMLAVLSLFYLHGHPRCREQVLSEAPSPDGHWLAAVMARRCGDEAPFFVHINLRAAGSPLRLGYFSGRAEEGEVFEEELESFDAAPALSWISPLELSVRCRRCRFASAQKHQDRLGTIRIHYGAD